MGADAEDTGVIAAEAAKEASLVKGPDTQRMLRSRPLSSGGQEQKALLGLTSLITICAKCGRGNTGGLKT